MFSVEVVLFYSLFELYCLRLGAARIVVAVVIIGELEQRSGWGLRPCHGFRILYPKLSNCHCRQISENYLFCWVVQDLRQTQRQPQAFTCLVQTNRI